MSLSQAKMVPLATSPVKSPAIVFIEHSPALGATIMSRDLSTGLVTRLMPWTTTTCPDEPRLSPDGTTVLFTDFLDSGYCGAYEGGLLRVLHIGSGIITNLFSVGLQTSIRYANYSPDGKTVVFSTLNYYTNGQLAATSIETIPAGGSYTSTGVYNAGATGLFAVYSPDGQHFAELSRPCHCIGVMTLSGSHLVTFPATASHSPYDPMSPSWSPDGLHLTYTYARPVPGGLAGAYAPALATINVDGTGDHTLPSSSRGTNASFESSWSADSSEIYYDTAPVNAAGGVAGSSEIDATSADGIRNTRLVTLPKDSSYSPWFHGPEVPAPLPTTFTSVTPTHVLSRTNLGTGGVRDLKVAGVGQVPAGVSAVTLNLTGIASARTYLQVYPRPTTGNAVPLNSSESLAAGQTAAIAVQAAVSADGYVRIRNYAGSTGVIVDVSGYFSQDETHQGYFPLSTPVRALDAAVAGGTERSIDVATLAGAPSGATAVVLNLTAVTAGAATYEAAVPTASGVPVVEAATAPASSNLNLSAHDTRANLVTVPIGPDGRVSIYNYRGSARTIVDVQGFYAAGPGGLAFLPVSPGRVLDTRVGTNTHLSSTAPLLGNGYFDLLLYGTTTTTGGLVSVPADASAAVLTLTAVEPTQDTYLTAYAPAAGSGRPTASNLNPLRGVTTSNLVISKLAGSNGVVRIFNLLGSAPVVADLSGYYSPLPG